MEMRGTSFDVIVVDAGPACATAAYKFEEKGSEKGEYSGGIKSLLK